MQIYSKKKCFFSLISWPIFILFVLSDRARWGFVHKISNFNNYANLCKFIQNHKKITKNASSSFQLQAWYTKLLHRILICSMVINFALSPKIIASSPSFLDRFSFCLFSLIGLGRGFKTCTQNFRNWLIMLIYANVFKITKKKKMLLLHFSTDFDLVCFIW